MTRIIALGIAGSLIVAACASADSGNVLDQPDRQTTTSIPNESPADPESGAPDDPASSGLVDPGTTPPGADDSDSLVPGGEIPPGVDFATEDLARYLGVSIDLVDWVSFEDVLWSDAALGCPQPDTSYTQAVVAGSLIVFEVEGTTYEYHAAQGSDPFLCSP